MPTPKKSSHPDKSRASSQAERMKHVREAHSMEIAEDYAEAIADLITSKGAARVTDLAKILGVTHVTVTRTITRLQQAGYVTSLPYRSIFLTEKGKKLAAKSKQRHDVVVSFLRSLGIPEAIAKRDAEGIEHHVSKESLAAFKRFIHKTK